VIAKKRRKEKGKKREGEVRVGKGKGWRGEERFRVLVGGVCRQRECAFVSFGKVSHRR